MIDLRSDTVTRPDAAMREAAASADVGDDVMGEDPTVNTLQERAAKLLGMEAALFCPSGTMANQVAVRTHTDRGQEILLERESHLYKWELAGVAQHSALQTRPVDAAPRGVIAPTDVTTGVVESDDHRPGTGLVAAENTHNSYGGRAISPERIDAIGEQAHALDIPLHLDGARLCNAAVAHNVDPARYTRHVDSVMLSLSKGLGAPVGSVVAGSKSFIEQAHRHRKLFGGGMRQAGIIAAPALRALENIDRLTDDHDNAKALARGLDELDTLAVTEPETNIVLVDTTDTGLSTDAFLETLSEVDVLASPFGDHLVRFVTHRDVTESDINTAIDRVTTVLS